tara:strand:+ start:25 stop:510 length:486 start_codon:yes stop_codon:yes gene_type:complete
MAHFAELESKTDPTGFTSDTHLVVKRVIVVGNDVSTAAGPLGENDMHVDGETWCQNFFKGGTWKQTSYNHNFRKRYAGQGDIYDSAKNKFLSQQPYASWSLDANDDWQAPVTYPTITTYGDPEKNYSVSWDEAGQKWTAKDKEEPQNSFNWDASGLTWVSA